MFDSSAEAEKVSGGGRIYVPVYVCSLCLLGGGGYNVFYVGKGEDLLSVRKTLSKIFI